MPPHPVAPRCTRTDHPLPQGERVNEQTPSPGRVLTKPTHQPLSTIVPRDVGDVLRRALEAGRSRLATEEIGTVIRAADGVAEVTGLRDAGGGEVVRFASGITGMVADLDERAAAIILLGDISRIAVGMDARHVGRPVEIPVGEELLGRVIDPLGNALDNKGPFRSDLRFPVERPAPAIIARAPVAVPLQTGIKAIDAAIPIGRGQRQLILGDRQTGKTAIALSAIANQSETGVISVYCAIGQRGSEVRRSIAALERSGAMRTSVVVVAGGDDPPGVQYIAPYAATAIAEYFMETGRDCLVVYDDITHHARAYRELSLLLRRPPGREAYPGDIFYAHSRLLERATHLRAEHGGGSLTALPIVETQAQNIAAYISTNLISITDGQVYLSPELFRKGQLPAIDIGRSVSRVGGKAQLPAFRAVAGDLRLTYAQFEELEMFARFGTRLDDETRRRIDRGLRVRAVLNQGEHERLTVPEQIAVLLAATGGAFDAVPLDRMRAAELAVRHGMTERCPDLQEAIVRGERLTAEDRARLMTMIDGELRKAGLV